MKKKLYNEFVRDNFVCRSINEPVNEVACEKLIDHFIGFEIVSFYKFMSLESAFTLSNIKNNIFHFSLIDQLNDPFEFANEVDVIQEIKRRNELLKHVTFIEEPTEDEIKEFLNPSKAQSVMNQIKEYTFVYSLTTTFDNAPMWYSYAGDYNGICVEYDAIELFKKYSWRITPVEYVDEIPIAEYDMNEENILKFIHRTCTTKNRKWINEDEWRITKIEYYKKIKELNEVIKPKSVTIGKKVSNESKKRLFQICKKQDILVYELCVSSDSYKLERKLVNI